MKINFQERFQLILQVYQTSNICKFTIHSFYFIFLFIIFVSFIFRSHSETGDTKEKNQ